MKKNRWDIAQIDETPLINFVKKGTGSTISSFPCSSVTDPSLAKTSEKTVFPQSVTPPVAKSPVVSTSKHFDIFLPVTTPKLTVKFSSISQACSTPETSRVSFNESQKYVSPFDVRPMPKMIPTFTSSRKRKSQKSEILTLTPIKEEQLKKFNIKVSKEKKQAVTKALFTKEFFPLRKK